MYEYTQSNECQMDLLDGTLTLNGISRQFDSDLEQSQLNVSDAIDKCGFGCFQFHLVVLLGLIIIAISVELFLLITLTQPLVCDWQLLPTKKAFLATSMFVGQMMGSLFWGFFSDVYGRKKTILIIQIFIGYFGLLTAFSPSYYWILACRCLVGFGIGGGSTILTLLTEFIPTKYRAKVLIVNSIWFALGASFQVVMAYFIIPQFGWRLLVALSALPLFVTVFLTKIIPESPRYLIRVNKTEKAQKVINKMRRQNRISKPIWLKSEIEDSETSAKFSELLNKNHRITFILLLILWFGTIFTYYAIILLSSQYLYLCGDEFDDINHALESENCCESTNAAQFFSMILSSFGEFFIIPIEYFLVDLIGRKGIIVLQFLFVTIIFCVMATCPSYIWALIGLFLARGMMASIMTIINIYTNEYFPTNIRSSAVGICNSASRIASITVPFVSELILPTINVSVGINIYSTIAAICFISSLLLPYETKGKSLRQQSVSEIEVPLEDLEFTNE